VAENKYLSDVGSVLHWSLPFLEMVTQISLPRQMFMDLDEEDCMLSVHLANNPHIVG
jgi:hypothetical protein